MVGKVFSLGGSVIRQNLGELDRLASALQGGEQVVVVTGAGGLKKYQSSVEDSGNRGEQDLVGIAATRLHARTLGVAMEAHPSVPETPGELLQAVETGRDVVMGGLVPGYSTDAVAATAAELLEAELYIATTVDGVYTAPPEEEGAERLEEVTPGELLDIVQGNNQPGDYALIDETAVRIIERSSVRTRVFEATLENLGQPEKAVGTEIVHEVQD